MRVRQLTQRETLEALSEDFGDLVISDMLWGEVAPHEWDQFPTRPHLRHVIPSLRHDGVFLTPGYVTELMKAGIEITYASASPA